MRTLRDDVINREQTPISYDDIRKVLDRHHIETNLCVLEDLPKYPTTRDIFKGKQIAIVLCTMFKNDHPTNIAHWITMFKRGVAFEVYDSLGNSLVQLVHKLNAGTPLLRWAKGKQIRQNSHKHQKSIDKISDCGCFAATRIMNKAKSNSVFHTWLTHSFINPDLSVSILCYFDLLV